MAAVSFVSLHPYLVNLPPEEVEGAYANDNLNRQPKLVDAGTQICDAKNAKTR
jgi:hypothetical protein